MLGPERFVILVLLQLIFPKRLNQCLIPYAGIFAPLSKVSKMSQKMLERRDKRMNRQKQQSMKSVTKSTKVDVSRISSRVDSGEMKPGT